MAGRTVYGIGPVTELLARRAREVAVLYVDEKRLKRQRDPVRDLVKTARAAGVTVEFSAREALDALAGTDRHQGALALVGEYRYHDLHDLLARLRERQAEEPALLIALDRVQDPRNLGAIIRSAYLLGAHGVIIPRDNAAAVTAVATKTSAGATEHMPVCQVGNLSRALEQCKQSGLWLAAVAASAGAQPIDTLDASMPLCLVLGAEGSGLRRVVAEQCDFHVVIPMAGEHVGSFNVSVAASIALYDVVRRRRAGHRNT